MKDHDSACGNHDVLACFWISSRAGLLTSHGERAKAGDREGFSLLQSCLEEFKKPIEQRGRVFFRDPGFLMDAVSDILLLHWTLVHRRPWDFSVNNAHAMDEPMGISLRFRGVVRVRRNGLTIVRPSHSHSIAIEGVHSTES